MVSLDALRGFDMFWIAGGGALISGWAKNYPSEWITALANQFQHVPWAGFRFYDLIFPLFMFISGAVIPFSLLSKLEKGAPKNQLVWKTLRRVILLIICGMAYNGVFRDGFSNARYVSVLGQIGIAYFFATLIVLFSGSQLKKLLWLIGIIAGVALMQLFVPVPGIGAGVLTPEGCINGYIDRMIIPGRLAYGIDGPVPRGSQGIYDALGILSTVSSVGITLLGYFAGVVLKRDKKSGTQNVSLLSAIGAGLIILSLLISPFYPVIKNCWTSTFTLLGGGISFLLVALFYLIIDVWGRAKWSFFFRVIGMNSIFVYLFYRFVNIREISGQLFGWLGILLEGETGKLTIAFGSVLLVWLLLYYMYKKNIFIRI
jgi:predicted acyltransferase